MTKHIDGLTAIPDTIQTPGATLLAPPTEPQRRVMLMAWAVAPDGKLVCHWHAAFEAAPDLQA